MEPYCVLRKPSAPSRMAVATSLPAHSASVSPRLEGRAAARARHLFGARVASQRLARQPEGEDEHAHRQQEDQKHRSGYLARSGYRPRGTPRLASSRQCRASSGGQNGRDSKTPLSPSSPNTAPIFFSNRSHLTTAPVFLSFRGALRVLSLCRSTYMYSHDLHGWHLRPVLAESWLRPG